MKNSQISVKKILLIILCVICTFLVIKRDKVIKFFEEEKYYNSLVRLHLLKKCYNPSYNFEDVFAQEGLDYDSLNQKVINDSLSKLAQSDLPTQTNKIPNISHKIFFTSNSSINLSEFYLTELQINYTKLNALGDWQHNFWTNQQTIIPENIRNIKGVRIRFIEEFESSPLYPILVDLVKKGQEKKPYLAQAADLLRLMVVQQFGGFYSDVDYEIYNPQELLNLMKKFDFIGGREHWGINCYYGNSFIAAKPNHPVFNEAIAMSIRNYNNTSDIPKYLQYSCSGHENLYFNGPPLITISYFKKNNLDGNNDIILPPWMVYNVSFIRYKNHTCDLQTIQSTYLEQKNQQLDQLIANFVDQPQIIESHQNDLLTSGKLHENIFYSLKYRKLYPIIGADMFCGTWTDREKTFKKNYYWNLPSWE